MEATMAASAPTFIRKLEIAILGGLIVGISATAVDLAAVSYNREVIIHQNIAMKEGATDGDAAMAWCSRVRPRAPKLAARQ